MDLRKYRIQINPYNPGFLFNNTSTGIALFDLLGTFLVGYVLDYFFMISSYLHIPRITFLLSLIPLSIIIHLLFNVETYLLQQLGKGDLIYWSVYIIFLVLLLYSKLYLI